MRRQLSEPGCTLTKIKDPTSSFKMLGLLTQNRNLLEKPITMGSVLRHTSILRGRKKTKTKQKNKRVNHRIE